MYKLDDKPIRKHKTIVSIEKPKPTMFYNEIVGIMLILFSVIVFLRLGDIGYWLYKLFKVILGDVYFLYLIIFLFIGFTNVFNHKKFNYKNQKFIGLIILLLDLSLLCHIPIHNYVKSQSEGYFKETFKIYVDYITLDLDTTLGGGLIGSVVFFCLFKLFSFSGVIIICIMILVFGVSLFVNKSFNELLYQVKIIIKKVLSGIKNFNNFFKYDIGIKRNTQFKKYNYKLPLKIFETNTNMLSRKFQEKISEDNLKLIENLLRKYDIEYKFVRFDCTYNQTNYKFCIYDEINKEVFAEGLKGLINSNIMLGISNDKMVIEINNEHCESLYLRDLLLKQKALMNNFIIPVGITSNNEIMELDLTKIKGILLNANSNEALNFISQLMYAVYIKNSSDSVICKYYDQSNNLDTIFNNTFEHNTNNIFSFLDEVIDIVDVRLKILEKNNCNDINEYNIKCEIEESRSYLTRMILVINIKDMIDEALVNEKIFYILESGTKVGINIIYYNDSNNKYEKVFRLFDYYISFKSSHIENYQCLVNDYDCFITIHGKPTRLNVCKILDKEHKMVYDFLKK